MKLTKFEQKLWVLVGRSPSLSMNEFFASLSKIMPPTCTPTERAFLDEIREKGAWFEYGHNGINEFTAIGIGLSVLYQPDFKANLKELVNE